MCGACDILFIHYATIGSPCTRSCDHHHQLTQNLLDLISERALNLSRRVEVLSQRTIREQLICYFMQLAAQAKASSFSLPFTMVDLADYLSSDRSAMTGRLKQMKEEGLIGWTSAVSAYSFNLSSKLPGAHRALKYPCIYSFPIPYSLNLPLSSPALQACLPATS